MGRNLDFSPKTLLEPLAYEVDVYKNKTKLFTYQGLAGYVGIMNGIKSNQFAVSLNQRYDGYNRNDTLQRFYSGLTSPLFLMLDAMLQVNGYQDALSFFTSQNITTPCYYILAGNNKNEGAIITRATNSTVDVDSLDVDNNKWYLVETNSDRKYLDDERRNMAENLLNQTTSLNVSSNYLLTVMMSSPVKNYDTIFSSLQFGGNITSIYWNDTETVRTSLGFLEI